MRQYDRFSELPTHSLSCGPIVDALYPRYEARSRYPSPVPVYEPLKE